MESTVRRLVGRRKVLRVNVVVRPDTLEQLLNGLVWINGVPLERPSELPPVRYYPYGSLIANQEVNCGEGYFMLGDDSRDSFDSRFTGPVSKERFRGRVWCVIAPTAHRRFVQ